MYEQYTIILTSLLLGLIVGVALSTIVAAQFFNFAQLPFRFIFPTTLILVMFGMSLVTTFLAVVLPVRQINKHRIA